MKLISAATAHLLDLDPDLGESLDPLRRRRAALGLEVALHCLPRGPWSCEEAPGLPREGALLVVEGCLLRQMSLAHRAGAELLGPGDLVRPWQNDSGHVAYPYDAGYEVVDDVTVASLDLQVLARLGEFPEITAALMERSLDRSRRAVGHLVLAQFASVEHRVLLALWHLADRWGRVGTEGVRLPLPLTHRVLGLIVGARRPSVTSALSALAEQDLVRPLDSGAGFLLRGGPPQGLALARGSRHGALSG